MKTDPRRAFWGGIALAAIMGLGFMAQAVMAQEGSNDQPPKSKKEKVIQFQMADQKWDKVIQFLVDNGDFQYLNPSSHPLPKSAFTFIGPAKRTFTITEVFDTINTALMKDNLLLLRRNDKLILVKANDAIPEVWVPRITPEDLPNYGHTDILLVVVSPKNIKGNDYLQDVKNILGPFGRVTPLAKTNKLLVQDMADNIRTALRVLGDIDVTQDSSNIAVVPLAVLESDKATKMLEQAFGEPSKGGPFLHADVLRNAVIVRGTIDQIQKVRLFIKEVEKTPDGKETGNVRVFTLEKGSAVTLAEEIKRTMVELRNYQVELIFPGSSPQDLEKSKPGKAKPGPEDDTSADRDAQQVQLFDPRKGVKKTKVSIAAFGNKMIVTSDDQEALKLAQELVILYTRTAPGEGDFQVMRLKYASAPEVSRMLDEFFNGPKATTRPGGGGGRPPGGGGKGPRFGGGGDGDGGNPFAAFMGGGGPPAPEKESRVRVVADPNTNSILVKAAPLDMLTIRNRLLPMIDNNDNESLIPIRTQDPIKLQYASALDVFSVLKDVYRESMNNNNRRGVQEGNIFTGGRTLLQNIDAQGNPRGVTLSIGVDEKLNTIIVACPDLMYDDIKKLVKQLDVYSEQVIEVKQVVGVDPNTLQQAIDAIQGRKVNGRNDNFGQGNGTPFNNGNTFFRPGGNGPGGGTFFQGGGGGGPRGPGGGGPGGGRKN